MEELMKQNKIPYYEDNSRISNSAIGWYLKYGPRYLKDMLDGKEQGISGKFLEKGTMIHMYLLQPDEFWDNYKIVEYEMPTNTKQKELCLEYAKSLELIEEDKILDAYRKVYSNTKSNDKVIEEARVILTKYKDYIDSQSNNDGKSIISFADLNNLKTIKKNVESHKLANKLLFDSSTDDICHNEFHINWKMSKYEIELKSLLDRFIVNHTEKCITLVDIKTTAKLYEFEKSVEEFDYYRQLAFYILALVYYFQEEEGNDISEYDFKAYIVAISNDSKGNVRVFDMTQEKILEEKGRLIADTIGKISFHYKNDVWDHKKEYYDGDGSEYLKPCVN